MVFRHDDAWDLLKKELESNNPLIRPYVTGTYILKRMEEIEGHLHE